MNPLVTLMASHLIWIERGQGWLLNLNDSSSGWSRLDFMTTHVSVAGRVLKSAELAAVIARWGTPEVPRA
jgi:hypothetical protein